MPADANKDLVHRFYREPIDLVAAGLLQRLGAGNG
jgi:hypothetical protein